MAKRLIESTVVCNLALCLFYLPALGQNLVEMSFLPTRGTVFSVETQSRYLYLAEFRGASSMFKSVDISNPARPTALDSFYTAGFITDFALNGKYAYLSMADNEFGLRILDISDPAKSDFCY